MLGTMSGEHGDVNKVTVLDWKAKGLEGTFLIWMKLVCFFEKQLKGLKQISILDAIYLDKWFMEGS